MPLSKKIDLQRNFAADVYLSAASSHPMTPYPPAHCTVYVYTVYLFTQGREEEMNQREG